MSESPTLHKNSLTWITLSSLSLFRVLGFDLEEEVERNGSTNYDTTQIETYELLYQREQGRVEHEAPSLLLSFKEPRKGHKLEHDHAKGKDKPEGRGKSSVEAT